MARRGRPAKMAPGMMMDKPMGEPMMGPGMMMCCGSWFGIIHILLGAGAALLFVSYFSVPDVMFWGWVLLGAAAVGHFWKLMMHKRW